MGRGYHGGMSITEGLSEEFKQGYGFHQSGARLIRDELDALEEGYPDFRSGYPNAEFEDELSRDPIGKIMRAQNYGAEMIEWGE